MTKRVQTARIHLTRQLVGEDDAPLADTDDQVRQFARELLRHLPGDALRLLRSLKQAGHAYPDARTAPVRFRKVSLAQCADVPQLIQNPLHMIPFPVSFLPEMAIQSE